MKSEHLTMYYRSPKAGKGSTERHQASPSPNELWDILERRVNPKPFSTVRNVQLDPEILSENIFVSSPNLRLHKSSPRFFIAHQKSPERAFTTSRIIHDPSLQKFATLPSKSELSSTPTVLGDRTTNIEKSNTKNDEGCIPAPKSSISISKKTNRVREGPREVVIQLGDENEPLQMSQSEQPKTKRVSEEKRAQKPAIKICTDILIKGLSPRNMKDLSCKSAAKPNDMGISCRNMTAQTTTSTVSTRSVEERKHIRTNPISMSRQSTEDLHSRAEKSPLPKNKDYKTEAKYMQVLKTPENAKNVKRFEQTKRFKEAKSFVDDRRNASKKKSKSKAESVLSSHKKSGYGSMLNSSSKKSDWNTIAIKKIELSLDGRDSFASRCRNARCGDQLEDLVVFKEVLEFLSMTSLCQITKVSKKFRSTKHLSLVKKAQCRVIINGLSYEEQYSFWDCQVNFAFLQKAYPLQYMMNSMKPSVFEKDILNDIDRTRNLPLSKQNALQKILLAFSNTLPKIGYLQGINSIAAVFLSQKLTEPEVYWLMKFIFQKKRFGEVFSDNFGKVHLLTYQLEIYIRNYLPRIVDHLGESEMSISYFATQWFITMFSYDLELSQLVKTWNLFFIKGWKVIIRIALSILWVFQDEICSKPADELPTYLKIFVMDRIANIPEEDLFGAAMSFKVSNRLLKYLETLYEHSAPINVILVSGHENKLQWKILPDDCTPRTISSAIPKDLMEYLNENIDHMRSVNRMKGDVCNQLDNYRNIPFDRANTSITLDSISLDYRSPMKLQSHPHHQVIKSSDLSFIQTLSSLGRKLKQILTPKSGSQSIYPHFKSAEHEIPDFTNDRDALEAYTPLTEQSEHRSTQSMSRKTGRTPSASGHTSTAFKKSIVSVLKNSNAQLGINLIDHEHFSVQRDRDVNRRIAHRSIMMPSTSSNPLLNHTERKKPFAEEEDRYKHKRNSSVHQESLNSLHEYKSICFGEMLNEKSEKDNISQAYQQGCTTPSECKTEPFDAEMDKSSESITKKKTVSSSSKSFFLNGKYANKGKSFDKIKIVTSHHGRSGLTWNDYQRIYNTLDNTNIPQERVATLTTPKEGKLRARTRQYDIRM